MNSGLAGQMNNNESMSTSGSSSTTVPSDQVGSYGTFLNQLATRRYPTYEAGIQLSFPLRNRVAQADAIRDELTLRASEARVLMIQNQAELEAEDAMIALRRARGIVRCGGAHAAFTGAIAGRGTGAIRGGFPPW
jgi:outer membrane protein